MIDLPGSPNSSDQSDQSDSPDQKLGASIAPGVQAFDEFFSQVYEELRRKASSLRRRDPGATISSRALVDEAWLKLRNSPHLAALPQEHFLAIAAKAMRQVLVESARRRNSIKRGRENIFVTLGDFAAKTVTTSDEVLALNAALNKLAELNPRQAAMVEFRFFVGLSVTETAKVMGVSESVIERDWRAAKAWLAVTVRAGEE